MFKPWHDVLYDWEIIGNLGVFSSHVPEELYVCPVAVPAVTLGVERYMLTMGASAEN